MDVDLKKFELVKSASMRFRLYGGLGFMVRVGVIEVPRPDTIQHVDGAKEWKGLLSKRLIIFMPDFSFGLDRRSERVKRKIKYCADMVLRIV